jgi:rhodanese-related sulfurtransferase
LRTAGEGNYHRPPVTPLTRRFHIPSALRRSSFRLEVQSARALIANGALLVDVRRQDDPSAALEGAVRIAPDEVPGRLPEFRREVAIVLACT